MVAGDVISAPASVAFSHTHPVAPRFALQKEIECHEIDSVLYQIATVAGVAVLRLSRSTIDIQVISSTAHSFRRELPDTNCWPRQAAPELGRIPLAAGT